MTRKLTIQLTDTIPRDIYNATLQAHKEESITVDLQTCDLEEMRERLEENIESFFSSLKTEQRELQRKAKTAEREKKSKSPEDVIGF